MRIAVLGGVPSWEVLAMRKALVVSHATAASTMALLAAGPAFAAQNVANPNQKGSLLVWPLITTGQSTANRDTLVEISNDALSPVHVECEYVNEKKGRVNFDFELSGKQAASWDVGTQDGDQVQPPPFPTNTGDPATSGDPHRGELVCLATDDGRMFQVAWNELTGTATVINLGDIRAVEPKRSFKYNAWAFAARNASGVAPDNNSVPQGTPGSLMLSGANAAGSYDACPLYITANFMPNTASFGTINTIKSDLAVVSCNQDLREHYRRYNEMLAFTVWNSSEESFSGAYACESSVDTVQLLAPSVTEGEIFNYSTLRTAGAKLQVQGISATPPCKFPTQASGLLGIVESSATIASGTGVDALVGSTTQGSGAEPGFVKWDPSGSTPPGPKR